MLDSRKYKTILLDEVGIEVHDIQPGDLLWLRHETNPWLILAAKQLGLKKSATWGVSFLLDEQELGICLDENDLKEALIYREGMMYRFTQ